MAQRRTTHRSSKGTKLYAVRKADGTFDDVQTHKRAHAADLRGSAKGESSAKSKAAVANKSKQAARTTVEKAAPVEKAASAGGGLLARARKAVGNVLTKVITRKSPAQRAAKKTA